MLAWILLLHVVTSVPPAAGADRHHLQGLNLWLDGKQVSPPGAIPDDVFLVRKSVAVNHLQDAYFDHQLPVLAQKVDRLGFLWSAKNDMYTYKFSDLRSLDPEVLFDPMLSIPKTGIVPRRKTEFHLMIPCTGDVTGIASMYVLLHLHDSRGFAVPGSPLKLHLRKRCLSFESRSICKPACENGGECDDNGQCLCKPGYYGATCQQAVCFPSCQNDGVCSHPMTCSCAVGFRGVSCQEAICKMPCLNSGVCHRPDKCQCPAGFYGEQCQIATGQCKIPCKNSGVCTRENVCRCESGYVGEFCQKPICRRSCGIHGRCVDVDTCQCYRGWRGRFCHKTTHRRRKRKNQKNRRGRNDAFCRNERWRNLKRRMTYPERQRRRRNC